MYLLDGPGTEVKVKTGVGVQETAEIKIGVLLFLIGVPLALRRMRDPAI